MPRLIDDLRSGGASLQMPWFVAPRLEDDWEKHTSRVMDLLRGDEQLPVLLIDNVSEYYFQSEQEHWDLVDDFPNLAPPFQQWWSEFKLPPRIHSKEKGDTDMSHLVHNGRVGVLATATDAKEANGEGIPEAAKWILWCELFVDFGERHCTAQGTHGSIFLCIDEHGVLVDRPSMQSFDGGSHADVMRSYMTWLYPMLLAVCFLHCKNVIIVDNSVAPKLAKRYRERHGVTPRPFKTLVIEPLKKILRTEGRSGSVGLAKAMHICRGHFKDYRQGRGLFGKYHQLVWQPMLVRGSKGEKAPAREIEVKL